MTGRPPWTGSPEQKRRISISAAMAFVEWDKHRINILDTPGDANFAMDTKSCLRVADGAVVVIDAVGGVEFQTEKVWEAADEYTLPRLIFINKMDRERANFENTLNSVKEKLGKKATPLFIPIGAEDKFKGVIDLMQMKALFFDDPKGKPKAGEIPAELADQAKKYREAMTEDIAECDEALMDKYLESGELTAEELKTGLRKGVVAGALFPPSAAWPIAASELPPSWTSSWPPCRHRWIAAMPRERTPQRARTRSEAPTRRPPSPPSFSRPSRIPLRAG